MSRGCGFASLRCEIVLREIRIVFVSYASRSRIRIRLLLLSAIYSPTGSPDREVLIRYTRIRQSLYAAAKYPPILSCNYRRRAHNSPFVPGFLYHWVTPFQQNAAFSAGWHPHRSSRWNFWNILSPSWLLRQCINILLFSRFQGTHLSSFDSNRELIPRFFLRLPCYYLLEILSWITFGGNGLLSPSQFFFSSFSLAGRRNKYRYHGFVNLTVVTHRF